MAELDSMLSGVMQNDLVRLVMGNEYIQSVVILAAFLVLGAIVNFVLKNWMTKITSKTKTDLDDIIFGIISKPIFVIVNLIGVYFAVISLSVLEAYTSTVNSLIYISITLIVAFAASRVVSLIIGRWMSEKAGLGKAPELINRIVMVLIYVAAALAIAAHFGVEITPAIAALGVGGLAIGLALQSTLTNFFAGLHIISDRPVVVGDYIELKSEGVEGHVVDISWRSTRIRTLADTIVVIPNAKLSDSVIVNDYSDGKEINFKVSCGVSYGSDLDEVESATLDVARWVQKNSDGAVRDFQPVMRFEKFGDSNIDFKVTLRAQKIEDNYQMTHDFIKALKKRFDKEGIEISHPVRKIYDSDRALKK
ncbi:MAG: mechanosensitive ion channel family protein [Candidatus Aenigmarchaeota archaeon]|nr:mechanosensitive ion channel family protein [Candidatus Aenigmarchaeota archaeon]